MEEMKDKVKKNIFDLEYNRYLQYYNTAIIILFTYVIGIAIAFFARQIEFTNISQLFIIGLFSLFVSGIIIVFMIYCRNKMKNILEGIRSLCIE